MKPDASSNEQSKVLASHAQDDEGRLRASLVETLVHAGDMPTVACRRAFLRVPRHLFVPYIPVAEAYKDAAIFTHVREEQGHEVVVSSSSAPSIMATNIGQLRLRPGMRVLEIGAGTGYNAAILAEIVGAENVVSIDLDEDIVTEARAHLDIAGYADVSVDVADGWGGYPTAAPYDRILVAVGVHDVAPAWLDQLRESGAIVVWLSFRCIQLTVGFRKRNDTLVSERISFVWAMDLRGKQPRRVTHRHGDRLTVWHDAMDDAQVASLDEILSRPAERLSVPEVGAACNDFYAFLALSHPWAVCLYDARLRAHGIQETVWGIADLETGQLAIAGGNLCFGGLEIGEELRHLVRQWVEMGRPGLDRLALTAFPRTLYPDPDLLPPGRWRGW